MKKGFTLVELLGVIVILAVIATLTLPITNGIIKDSKEKSYKEQINTIISNSKNWAVENSDSLSPTTPYKLNINTLISGGYIGQDVIKDPRDNTNITGCVIIAYSNDYNQYEYTYSKDC